MIGYYNYTVVLTYLGMLISFAGIMNAMNGDVKGAVICLILSGVCDMFDGKIASTRTRTSSEKRFGIQIDSLSDFLSFGVLPAVIGYCLNQVSKGYFYIACIYVLCALIRLAYFNVNEEERQRNTTAARSTYQGLPVTTAAIIIPVTYVISSMMNQSFVYSFGLACMAICFLLPIKVKKPNRKGNMIIGIAGSIELVLLMIGVGGY